MSDVRLYVDEDAAEHAVIQGLRARGINVLTTRVVVLSCLPHKHLQPLGASVRAVHARLAVEYNPIDCRTIELSVRVARG